jgi:hypothetical protein
MDPFSQVHQRVCGPAAPFEDERLLGCKGTLRTPVVVRDDCRGRDAEGPLDLGTTMMVMAVVAIDEECEPLWGQGELILQQTQCGAGMPEPDQIGRRHQQDLLSLCQRETVNGKVCTQEICSRVQDDVPIALAELLEEPLKEQDRDK